MTITIPAAYEGRLLRSYLKLTLGLSTAALAKLKNHPQTAKKSPLLSMSIIRYQKYSLSPTAKLSKNLKILQPANLNGILNCPTVNISASADSAKTKNANIPTENIRRFLCSIPFLKKESYNAAYPPLSLR